MIVGTEGGLLLFQGKVHLGQEFSLVTITFECPDMNEATLTFNAIYEQMSKGSIQLKCDRSRQLKPKDGH